MRKRIGAFLFAVAGVSVAASFSGMGQGFPQTRASTDPPLPPHGKLGQDLFLALDHRDLAQLKTLLGKGADPNARNGLEFTPLYIAAASHQTDAMKVLLKAGADKETRTTYGTPLSFAAGSGNVEGVKLLLSLGVKADEPRADGMTPLILAASVGATPVVADLIAKRVDVNAKDAAGDTALSEAARSGFLDTVKALVAAGADPVLDDSLGQTPLMLAAMAGHTEMVELLLHQGAQPNQTDNEGRTALFLAASYGDYPHVIAALLDGGAKKNVKDLKGRTAFVMADRHRNGMTCDYLGGYGGKSESPPIPTPQMAIKRSLAVIQASTAMFCNEAKCASCHQEGLGRIATGEAASHGFRLDPKLQRVEAARIGGMLSAMTSLQERAVKDPEAMKQIPLMEINEVSDMDGWMLGGLIAQKQPRTRATAAMAMCLAKQQSPDGSWTFSVPRVPMQSSFFTFTALAVHALEAYGPDAHRSEIDQRIARARSWLLKSEPKTSEDRALRLLGLSWCHAGAQAKRKATADILADQRHDGGWSQVPGGSSDAYATGQALYALRVAGGVAASDPKCERGYRFLLCSQDEDGSWFVNKRAMPANNYFSTGFPYGVSQYASFNGTCWAMLALLQDLR